MKTLRGLRDKYAKSLEFTPKKKKLKIEAANVKASDQKRSDIKARKKGMKDAVAGKNLGERTRIISRKEARSYLPDDLRKKPKSSWTGRDKQRARKARLAGMTKDTKKVNKRIKGKNQDLNFTTM